MKGYRRQNADCRHRFPEATLIHHVERPLRSELYQSNRTDSSLIPDRLILASGSPRRVALLGELGVPFQTVVSDAPETINPGLRPEAQAVALAERKARAVATRLEAGIVLGADTMVVLDGQAAWQTSGRRGRDAHVASSERPRTPRRDRDRRCGCQDRRIAFVCRNQRRPLSHAKRWRDRSIRRHRRTTREGWRLRNPGDWSRI